MQVDILKEGHLYKRPLDEKLGRTSVRTFVLRRDMLLWYKQPFVGARGTIQLSEHTTIEKGDGKLTVNSLGHRLVLTATRPWYMWGGPRITHGTLDDWQKALADCIAALSVTAIHTAPPKVIALPGASRVATSSPFMPAPPAMSHSILPAARWPAVLPVTPLAPSIIQLPTTPPPAMPTPPIPASTLPAAAYAFLATPHTPTRLDMNSCLDLNSASAFELEVLPGIGSQRAATIGANAMALLLVRLTPPACPCPNGSC